MFDYILLNRPWLHIHHPVRCIICSFHSAFYHVVCAFAFLDVLSQTLSHWGNLTDALYAAAMRVLLQLSWCWGLMALCMFICRNVVFMQWPYIAIH